MKISTRFRYGLRALIEIALHYGEEPIKRKEIVSNQNLSDSYVENILLRLKNNGIIISTRGANGGYILCKHPQDISLWEIARALEGSLTPIDCLENEMICNNQEKCPTYDIWNGLYQLRKKYFENIKLVYLLKNSKKTTTKQSKNQINLSCYL